MAVVLSQVVIFQNENMYTFHANDHTKVPANADAKVLPKVPANDHAMVLPKVPANHHAKVLAKVPANHHAKVLAKGLASVPCEGSF